jgi:luciferase-type oxidoreductase
MPDHENRGYRRLFDDGFSVGLFFPITTSEAAVPRMDRQVERARLATEVGFDALWFRDVPLFWPKFDDAGQVYDPWVYLSHVAAHTEDVALATGSVVLPLRHPLHVAKAAASVDHLSDGRLVLGVASGDRPPEFPAFGTEEATAPERFRESVRVLRRVWSEEYPEIDSSFGDLNGSLDLLPKPTTDTLPLLVTGHAGQDRGWIAEHGDGWVYYQRDLDGLGEMLDDWRADTDRHKPYVQVLHVDLDPDPTAGPERIHQGYAAGSEWFREHLRALRDLGVDHVMINVRHGGRDTETVLREFGRDVLAEL